MNDNWDDYVEDLVYKMHSSFSSIKEEAAKLIKSSPELRIGQAVHILSFKLFPNLSKKLDIKNDCYDDDKKIDSFLEELRGLINEYTRGVL